MLGLGVMELVLIALALMLLFGAKKIPLIARGIGEGIRNFKGEIGGPKADRDDDPDALEDRHRGRPREED
jgi:sec-independent protein translocase protein TatA